MVRMGSKLASRLPYPAGDRSLVAEEADGGFESHLTAAAGQWPLPTRQAASGKGLTLWSSWCLSRQASHVGRTLRRCSVQRPIC